MADSAALGDVGAGDLVRARRRVWQIEQVRREPEVTFLRLGDAADPGQPVRTLVSPFDRVACVGGSASLAPVSRRRAMRRLAGLVSSTAPFDVAASALTAPMRLLPFQFEPLLTLRTGLAARVLIADHVGLGKTIQAALIARDLRARRPDAAILILTPAGLREQWIAELRDRAALDAWLADAETLRARAAALPADVNPWRSPAAAVASIDFVKQPDVLRGLDRLLWDLLIVDEAHTLSLGSERLAAADALVRRSDRVVLLTATPHDGREDALRTLCELGRASAHDVLAIFRRTRAVAGATHRRVTRRLAVRPRDRERRLHDLLDTYARRVWRSAAPEDRGAARLAMTVLVKRAASSAASLAQSLERRRTLLDARAGLAAKAVAPGAQTALPFTDGADDDGAPDAVLAAPGLPWAHERTWLNLLAHAARAAARDEAKRRALIRLVRRVREPIIVFTEYRDTLAGLEPAIRRVASTATIHGGCTPDARRAALEAFASGAARVLLATDAASEGLNLQAHCRIVVQVELPWSPTRMEQRVGRVDRLGQTRTVHALHLVASRVEAAIEARLLARVRRVRETIDADGDAAQVDAVAWLGAALAAQPATSDRTDRTDHTDRRSGIDRAATIWPSLRFEATRQVEWLDRLRRLLPGEPTRPGRRGRRHRPFVVRLRFRAGRAALPRGLWCLYRTRVTSAEGETIERSIAIVGVRATNGRTRDWARVAPVAQERACARAIQLGARVERRERLVRLRRAQALALVRRDAARVQLSLFPEVRDTPALGDHDERGRAARADNGIAGLESPAPEWSAPEWQGAAQLAAVVMVE